MGNCCLRCFGRTKKNNKFLRTGYNAKREVSIEFENLIEEDDIYPPDMTQYGAVLTEQELILLSKRKFNDLVEYQRQVDAEIHAQLREQEDQLRRDEEAFIEAKRLAAAARMVNKHTSSPAKPIGNWATPVEWELTNGDDDFEQFLENVKARSLKARMFIAPIRDQVNGGD